MGWVSNDALCSTLPLVPGAAFEAWARYVPPLRCEHRSAQDWRTARTARQGGSNVDLLGNAQRIFEFDTKVPYCAVYLGVSEQKLNRS